MPGAVNPFAPSPLHATEVQRGKWGMVQRGCYEMR